MTAIDVQSPNRTSRQGTDRWDSAMRATMRWAPLAGPALMVVAALFVSAKVLLLPGDLEWISEPEGLVGMLAAPFLVATWIAVGRRVSEAAPKTGVVVTLLGVVAATAFVSAMSVRLLSADLVEAGVGPTVVNDVWDTPTTFSALSLILLFQVFLVPIVAGVAVLKTGVAPRWAGAALIAFVPMFMAAQAAYAAIEVTYPAACLLLLAGVAGVTHGPPTPRTAP